MLTSIRQVNEQFFRTFYNIKINVGGTQKTVLCRYARKSSKDYVEEQETQIYPCIAIQDYSPVPKKEWTIDMKAYFGGKSLDGLTGYLYQRPIWMEFRYDVSIAAKSYNDFLALKDYFMENFVYGKRFVFNAQLSGEDLVGDIVPYEIRENDIPRTDGVYETNYEFTCSAWLYVKEPSEVTLIQKVIVKGQPMSLSSDFDKELTTLRVKVLPYDEEIVNGNWNKTRYGYAVVVGDVAELLHLDTNGFTVELLKGKTLIDQAVTHKGNADLKLPTEIGAYTLRLSKEGHSIEAQFSLKELAANLVFLWVFE